MELRRIAGWLGTGALALAAGLAGCDGGGGQQVGCVLDDDCPEGQVCVGRNCQLPEDSGVRFCTNELQCFIGERCIGGVCTVVHEEQADEPDASVDDGDEGVEDDGAQDDSGGGDDGEAPTDEDQRDFSRLNFSVAVRLSGTSGPASQCLEGVHPTAGAGPILPASTLVSGFSLSGQVRSGGAPLTGARVTVLGARADCLPPQVTTDGSGFSFYLPAGGPYDLQAVAADGRVGYARVASLQANATLDVELPAATALAGGPIYETGVPSVNGWQVLAYYRTGANAGRLAHAGVQSGPPAFPDGEFSLPLEVGPAYDLVGLPPAGSTYPMQLLHEDVCHPGQTCGTGSNLGSFRLKSGYNLLGRVSTAAGTGAAGSLLRLVKETDARLALSPSAGADGNYSVLLRPGGWLLTVVPSGAAFQQGSLLYVVPGQDIVSADVTKNISLGLGEMLTFVGRVVDTQGAGVAGAQVKLLVNDQPMAEGAFTGCDEAWTPSEADGTFRVRCNVAPP